MGRRADTPQTEAGRAIWKALERIERGGHDRHRVFRDWLDLILSAHLSFTAELRAGRLSGGAYAPKNEHEDAYMKIIGRYTDDRPKGERAADYFAQAYSALCQGIQDGGEDPLGDVYMSAISFGEHGQYFTPLHIAEAMAQMSCAELKDGQRVLDPACGAGIMLIAAAKVNPRALFYGIDLDERCAKMCTINLMLRGLSGSVWCGNALSCEAFTRWDIERGWITRDDNPAPLPMQPDKPEKPQQLTLL